MKVSIITCSLNEDMTISDTIRSIISQDYPEIEHIVVDGNSTDNTVPIIKSFAHEIDTFISEPDSGIYDAMNKGIKLSTGEIVGFLNAGDFYSVKTAVSQIASSFQKTGCQVVYSDLEYVAANNPGKTVRKWRSQAYQDNLFQKGWHPPHPTFYTRKSVFDRFGTFDQTYDIGADYEFMLRLLKRYNLKTEYIPHVLVKMRSGGISNKNLYQIIKANIECYRAWKKNGLKVSPLIILRKPFSKISQYIYAKN